MAQTLVSAASRLVSTLLRACANSALGLPAGGFSTLPNRWGRRFRLPRTPSARWPLAGETACPTVFHECPRHVDPRSRVDACLLHSCILCQLSRRVVPILSASAGRCPHDGALVVVRAGGDQAGAGARDARHEGGRHRRVRSPADLSAGTGRPGAGLPELSVPLRRSSSTRCASPARRPRNSACAWT